jgi:hypothetical protein
MRKPLISLLAALWLCLAHSADHSCDIVIVGGTLAALGAVIEAPTSVRVCLVEPTDRLGGQLGEEGVWHIDFNWLYQPGYPDNATAYNPQNLHSFLQRLSSQCRSGDCWVSRNCFLYSCVEPIINDYLAPRLAAGNLTILANSLPKKIVRLGSFISSLQILTRTPLQEDCRPAD